MSVIAPIAVYATRYALGRMTGAPSDVAAFIQEHAKEIRRDAGCREAILRDIREASSLGHECDAREWRRVVEVLAVGSDGGTE